MYKVMLLDDEPWELKGLKNMLPWGDYGFRIASSLDNPLEALELLEKDSFDVLVSDIRMPGLDGISLMKKIRTFDTDLEILFVSGYAEFEYAREALRAGAFDYLLKPLDLDLSAPLLSRLKEKLDEKNRVRLLRLIDQIGNEKTALCTLLHPKDTQTCLAIMGGDFLFTCFESSDSVLSFCIPHGRGCAVCFLACEASFQPEAFLIERYPDEHIGFSPPISAADAQKPGSLGRLMSQAFTAYHDSFFLLPAESAPMHYHETNQNTLRSISDQIHALYSGGDSDRLKAYIDTLPGLLSSRTVNVNGLVRLWNHLMLLCLTDPDSYEDSCFSSVEELLETFSDIRQFCQRLSLLLTGSAQTGTGSGASASAVDGRQLYGAMIDYVNHHFRETITLQDVADCVHISFTYASKLFKKYADTNYSKYLIRLRMELACELLSSTEKSTEEICYDIGYNDYFYFSKTFKKYTGQTPLQYRRDGTSIRSGMREERSDEKEV